MYMVWATNPNENEPRGEYFGTLIRAWKDDSIVVELLLDGHRLRLPYARSTNEHDVFEVTFATTTFTVEVDKYDSSRFPDKKSVATIT